MKHPAQMHERDRIQRPATKRMTSPGHPYHAGQHPAEMLQSVAYLADTGKTRVLAEIARIWTAGGGEVIGITPSQSARNTLAAGVPVSYNAAQFLGHLPGRRGARGPVLIGPGTLLVIDEASMLSGPDLADLITYAAARGAKIILAGDIYQLQAVENGGGMSLLAARLGYARLAEPVRFRHTPGNSTPACACATATPPCSPNTTSTPASSAATRSR